MSIQSYQLVKPDPPKPPKPELDIRLVSLNERRQIQGIDVITELLREQGFGVDHFEYKVVKKSEMRRPINPKLKNSPTEKVTVEEKLNVNANLKSVGQLEWRVLKDPENILHVQLARAKGEALCLPLFFENLLKNNKQILVTGLTNAVKLQLISKPDLKFLTIPDPIEQNQEVKEQLIQRASRTKGMQSTARELIDFPGLPEDINRKIGLISSGKKEPLTDAQAVNMILLSDLHSRYAATFQTFQNEIVERQAAVANLARQFEIFTQKISPKFLVSKFADFLGENAAKCKTNQLLFTYLYQKLQQIEEKKIYVNQKLLDRKDLFRLIRSIVCIARSQFDPDLWNRCFFFLNLDDVQTIPEENEQAIQHLIAATKGRKITKDVTGSKDLMEIFVTNNIYDYVIGKKISIDDTKVSTQELAVMKSVVAPRMHLKAKKGSSKPGVNLLFSESKGIHKLANPVQFVGSAYGVLMGEILKENLSKFLDMDKKELIDRFNIHFFDILYEQAVFEKGLHISRNQFAGWLEEINLIQKIEELGYVANEIESDFDKSLTPEVLAGEGISVFPSAFGKEDFEKAYVGSRNKFLMFLNKLQKGKDSSKDEFSPVKIIGDFISKGKYNLRSSAFRKHVRDTFLYQELVEMVKEATVPIKGRMSDSAINKKLILQLPHKFANILFLGNTFEVPTGKFMVQLRLHTIPVKEMQEDDGMHFTFSKEFSKVLQEATNEKRVGVIQAMRILGEYQKISLEFVRLQSIVLLDQVLNQGILKQKLVNRDPRFVKFKMPDVDKMTVGSVRDVNLGKLFQHEAALQRNNKQIGNNFSFGELVQSVMYYKSVDENLKKRSKTIQEIKILLNRFSKSLKKSQEWNTYSTLLNRFSDLTSIPISSMGEKVVKTLMDLSIKLNRLVTKFEYKNSVIAILHAEWKRKNPDQSKEVYFYLSFLGDDAPSGKTNILLEIRKARDLMRTIKTKKAIVFFPGATKEIQLNQMIEIKEFIKDQGLNPELYIETRTLSEDKIRDLAKEFYPTAFFEIDSLDPVQMPIKQKMEAKKN